MNKNQIKAIVRKEFTAIMAFVLMGIVGYLLLPYIYRFYMYHFPNKSNAPYAVVLRGWWFMIVIGYFLSFFARRS